MKRLALVGTASSWSKAPFANPEVDIWCHGSATQTARADLQPPGLEDLLFPEPGKASIWKQRIPRVTAFFEIHPRDTWFQWADGLNGYGVPVYMHQHFDDVPTSVEYPLAEIEARFPRGLFSCTTTYMIPLGIHLGYKQIGLYGIHVSAETEYFFESPGIHYWCGIAEAMGIEIVVPEESSVLAQSFRYGYEEPPAEIALFEYQLKLLDDEIAKNEKKAQEYRTNKAFLTGARAAFAAMARNKAQRA